MKFIVKREYLLKILQQVNSPLSGRPVFPILNNILLQVTEGALQLTSTNLEIEISIKISLIQCHKPGAITVNARKFLDIWRSLPEGATIIVKLDGERVLLCSGRSRFSFVTLPASSFPNRKSWEKKVALTLSQATLKRLIESTQFSMAYQDTRHYLNGMLFETENKLLRTVTTDGHRLAICSMPIDKIIYSTFTGDFLYPIIVPRKGVMELVRLLNSKDTKLDLEIGRNYICAYVDDFVFTCKLINGRFPNYRLILPKNPRKIVEVDCSLLKQAFLRVAILSSEKYRGVRLKITHNQLNIMISNSEQEEGKEILDVNYEGDELEICLNVNYILDTLNVLKCEKVHLLLTTSDSSVQIKDGTNLTQSANYIIMPIRF
ncbi:DNA polymerase III subunit beta [Candidatus Fukatsuia anoeciicola]|uniref:DNA polymerase III subunit beta n=1 Tax=Candidatus Fukatsuia anoeciicola TaxID=2994492 RepID=UPI0034645367